MRMKINITSNLIDKLKSYRLTTSSTTSTRNQSINKADSLQKSFLISKYKKKPNGSKMSYNATIYKIINKNLISHNSTPTQYNKNVIHSIIFDDKKHIVSVFKNYLLWDEISEFLRRYYKKSESLVRIPKISEYYEKYTLFPPVYFGLDDENNAIMRKFIKRKKKYLEFIEENEDTVPKGNSRNRQSHFEAVIKPEMIKITQEIEESESKTKNTVELTNYNDKKNTSKSLCSLINDLTKTYNSTEATPDSKLQNVKYKNLNKHNTNILSIPTHKTIQEKSSIISKLKVTQQPTRVKKLNFDTLKNVQQHKLSTERERRNEGSIKLHKQSTFQPPSLTEPYSLRNPKSIAKISPLTKRLVLKQLPTCNNLEARELSEIMKGSPNTRRNSKTLSLVSPNVNLKVPLTSSNKKKYILGRNCCGVSSTKTQKEGRRHYPYLNSEHSGDIKYFINTNNSNTTVGKSISQQKTKINSRNIYKYPLTSRRDKISTEEEIIKKILMRKRVLKK